MSIDKAPHQDTIDSAPIVLSRGEREYLRELTSEEVTDAGRIALKSFGIELDSGIIPLQIVEEDGTFTTEHVQTRSDDALTKVNGYNALAKQQEQAVLDTAKRVESLLRAALYEGQGEQFGQQLHNLSDVIVEMRKLDPGSLKAAMLDSHLENMRNMYTADMNSGTFTPANYEPSVAEILKQL